LGHQPEHLLRRRDDLVLQVEGAVFRRVVQEVPIVHHDAAGVFHAPGAGVGVPVEPPHGGAVLKVEVGHRVESVAPPLLPVEVPGAQAHQDGLQGARQALGARPLAGGDQLAEGVGGRGSRGRAGGLLHLLPLLLREEVGASAFLLALAEQTLEPRGETRDRRQAGELGHVRELALEDMRGERESGGGGQGVNPQTYASRHCESIPRELRTLPANPGELGNFSEQAGRDRRCNRFITQQAM